jgi:hypothetical protein
MGVKISIPPKSGSVALRQRPIGSFVFVWKRRGHLLLVGEVAIHVPVDI